MNLFNLKFLYRLRQLNKWEPPSGDVLPHVTFSPCGSIMVTLECGDLCDEVVILPGVPIDAAVHAELTRMAYRLLAESLKERDTQIRADRFESLMRDAYRRFVAGILWAVRVDPEEQKEGKESDAGSFKV